MREGVGVYSQTETLSGTETLPSPLNGTKTSPLSEWDKKLTPWDRKFACNESSGHDARTIRGKFNCVIMYARYFCCGYLLKLFLMSRFKGYLNVCVNHKRYVRRKLKT